MYGTLPPPRSRGIEINLGRVLAAISHGQDAADSCQFEAVPVQVKRMNVIAGIAKLEPVAAPSCTLYSGFMVSIEKASWLRHLSPKCYYPRCRGYSCLKIVLTAVYDEKSRPTTLG